MKKKVFSKLLMVALVATVGAFTSCKDYDDDINDLRSKVDGLNTSLTTLVNDKVTTVSNQVNLLEQQLAKVEDAYKAADAEFQKELTAAKETGKANTDAIEALQQELVNLYATKASLADAKKALEEALEKANAAIKANGDEIIKLVAADKALEDKIAAAQTAADNAMAEATKALNKANENASEISSLKTKEQADFDNLQKQISDNLTDVNAKIADVKKTLEDYIKTNNTEIGNLKADVTTNKTEIKNIKDKLTELEKTDTEIYAAIKAAQEKLEKADADAAAAQKEINDAQKTKNEELLKLIQANEAAIKTINETTIPMLVEDLKNHTIPDEVKKQLNAVLTERLQKFFDEDVTTLVNSKYNAAVSLIDALEEKVDSIDEAINEYVDAQFVIVAAAMDSISKAHDTKASELADAYVKADNLVKDSIGKVAAALESAKTTLGNNITTLNEQINGKGESKGIVGQIDALEEWFELAENQEEGGLLKYQEELLNAQAVKDAVKSIVEAVNGELYTMITSINLFANQHDAQNDGVFASWLGGFDHTLTFTYTIEKENVFPASADITDKQFTFEEGMYRSYSDSILVRVSPTNADLTAAFQAGNIALLNSQGVDVVAKEIIEVDTVVRFNRLLTATRSTAAGNETGLWVIKFKMNDRKIGTDFEDAATAKVNGQTQKVLYSIGVKNTTDKEGLKERYVVSEYDLDLSTAPAYPAWDFYVNGKSVAKIHNRYIETDKENVVSDDSTGLDKKTFRNEYTWIGYAPYEAPYAMLEAYASLMANENNEAAQKYVGMVPATKMILEEDDPENFNTVDRLNHTQGSTSNGVDNRHKYEILPVTVGEPISIDFPEWFQFDANSGVYYNNMFPTPIKGFYVTLDHDFALESIPSEINAWTGYEYENVGVFKKDNDADTTIITKAKLFEGNHGTITIKKLNNVSGDVIGFRVFAVNLDGTLTDPDGRAFYVKVGQEFDNELTFKVVAETYSESGNIQDGTPNPILAQNNLFKADKTGTVDPFFNVDKGGGYTYDITWGEGNPQIQIDNQLYTPAAGNYGVLGSDQSESYNVIEELFEFSNTKEEVAAYGDAEANWKKMEIKRSGKNVPTYETNNMAVQILKANSLIDGETYNLVLTIKKGSGTGAYNVVSKTLIHVIKTVPEALPKAFKVKNTLDVFTKNMKFYLRPIADENTWDLAWFDSRAEDFGVSALAPSASVSGGNYYIPWFVNSSGDQGGMNGRPNEFVLGSRTTRAYIDSYFDYRWATDVRPYNFEEYLAGLIDANNNFDQNYKFVFEGCGDYSKDNVAGEAISTYRMYNSTWIDFTGVNAGGTATQDMHPGYYLPLVYYQVIDKYNNINNKDNYVAVKAGYTYNYVSLTLDKEGKIKKDENGNYAYNKVITPSYFKADGTPTAKKEEAGFKATFYCAVHNTFKNQAGRYAVDNFKEYTGSADGSVGDGTAVDFTGFEFDNEDKYIPYAYGFTVTLDSIGVDWVSNLAALTSTDPLAYAAAYFRTNFAKNKGGFTAKYTEGDPLTKDGKSYYTDTLYAKGADLGGNYLYSKANGDARANWLRIADLSDVAVDFDNSTIEQLKADGTWDKDDKLTAATLAEYFIVTVNGNVVTFTPKTIAINPTKIGQMKIKVKATAKLIHQWGHVNATPFGSKAIYIGKPHSAQQTSRQSR